MHVFVTGATGFIGTEVVKELLAAGHSVLGMTRSDEGAMALEKAGAQVHRGTIEDLDRLRAGAAQSDGVIHLAFNHDFSRFAQNCAEDRAAIGALVAGLDNTTKPLLVTSGTAITNSSDGEPAMEDGPAIPSAQMPRAASEEAVREAVARGVNGSIMRLPQVHDPRRQGLISWVIDIAREKGVSAYIGDGSNRWPAAHVSDVARLYRLALEKAERGAVYHAVAEEGVANRPIAEVLGKRLGLPVTSIPESEAETHFGWLAHFLLRDLPASSARTRATLGWDPVGPGLLEDLGKLEVPTHIPA